MNIYLKRLVVILSLSTTTVFAENYKVLFGPAGREVEVGTADMQSDNVGNARVITTTTQIDNTYVMHDTPWQGCRECLLRSTYLPDLIARLEPPFSMTETVRQTYHTCT